MEAISTVVKMVLAFLLGGLGYTIVAYVKEVKEMKKDGSTGGDTVLADHGSEHAVGSDRRRLMRKMWLLINEVEYSRTQICEGEKTCDDCCLYDTCKYMRGLHNEIMELKTKYGLWREE